MRRWLRVFFAVAAGFLILAVLTIGALIGLNAECNGGDCPRSDAWRAGVIAMPVTAAILLLVGATWSVVSREDPPPLVLAEAAVLAVAALVDAVVYEPDLGTAVLLAVAGFVGWRALRR